jgi:hypothetical protein
MASYTNININNSTLENISSSNFRSYIAQTAIKHLFKENQIFFFASKETGLAGASADSLSSAESVYENITIMNRVGPDEACLVVPRKNWLSGKIYNAFDATKNLYDYTLSFSGGVSYDYDPYVMTDDYNVYLCIKNNQSGLDRNKVASTIKPTTTGVEPQQTKDGYTWKYLFSISDDLFSFLTNKWMPVPAPVDNTATITNKTSAKYRRQQVQIASVGGAINNVSVDLTGNKNIYFDTASPRVEVVGQGTSGDISLSTTYIPGRGYKLTGYNINNKGSNYVGGGISLLDSPNSNGDYTTKTAVENLITLETSYGGTDKDLGTDPRMTLQARTIMIIGSMAQDDGTLGSFPSGLTLASLGFIANPVYAEGTSFAGKVAGAEFGYGTNTRLSIRQAAKVKILDSTGANFTLTTGKSISDSRLSPNSKVTSGDVNATILDLRPYEFAGAGSSNTADLYTTGSKRPLTTSDVLINSSGQSFGIQSVEQPTLKVGSGDLLYIVSVEFNIMREQRYSTKLVIQV